MKPILGLLISTALILPAMAQDAHNHGNHDDHDHDHLPSEQMMPQTDNADILAAVEAGGSLVEVKILGMVCDFCATALTKTFGRRDEVAAVHVDLDTKLLSIVIKQGSSLDDGTIRSLVTSAGYKTETIHRAGAEDGDASDQP